jgi:molecular chaperone GrpE (heat shock protein)
MAALDDFRSTLNDIDIVKRRADYFAELLESECNDIEQRWQEAEQQRIEVETEYPQRTDVAETSEQTVRDLEAELVRVRDELKVWQRETLRRTVIAYCTAFETFLRDFLVEFAVSHPENFERYVQNDCGFR